MGEPYAKVLKGVIYILFIRVSLFLSGTRNSLGEFQQSNYLINRGFGSMALGQKGLCLIIIFLSYLSYLLSRRLDWTGWCFADWIVL